MFGDAFSEDFFVGCSGVGLSDPMDVEAGIAKRCDRRAREVLVREKSHAGSRG